MENDKSLLKLYLSSPDPTPPKRFENEVIVFALFDYIGVKRPKDIPDLICLKMEKLSRLQSWYRNNK